MKRDTSLQITMKGGDDNARQKVIVQWISDCGWFLEEIKTTWYMKEHSKEYPIDGEILIEKTQHIVFSLYNLEIFQIVGFSRREIQVNKGGK